VDRQEAAISQLKSTFAKQEVTAVQQQAEIKTLTAQLKEQAAQIRRVNEQIEVGGRAPQIVQNQ
jgi:hypothetical protein